MPYNIETDPDLNAFETNDLKDLTLSGLGTAGREVVSFSEFLIFMALIILVIGMISSILFTFTVLYKVK